MKIGWDVAALQSRAGDVLSLNRDIFIRSAVLTVVLSSFARFSAQFGDLTVAANHVLINLILLATLILDGAAIAAETLVGQALGSTTARAERFSAAVRTTSQLTATMALVLTALLLVLSDPILHATIGNGPSADQLIREAGQFFFWVIISPIILGPAFEMDGIFIGATRGGAMRNAMAASGLVYFGAAFLLPGLFGNHGLWAAFMLFMAARAVTLLIAWPGFQVQIAAAPQD